MFSCCRGANEAEIEDITESSKSEQAAACIVEDDDDFFIPGADSVSPAAFKKEEAKNVVEQNPPAPEAEQVEAEEGDENAQPLPKDADKLDERSAPQLEEPVQKTVEPAPSSKSQDDRPTCCTLRPGHTVEKVGDSRTLTNADRKQITDFLACAENPEWKPVSSMFGVKTTRKFMMTQEGNPLILIKGSSPVQCRAAEMFKFFSEPEGWYESMKIADTMFYGGSVLEVIDAHHMVQHGQFRTPPGITNRDFCFSGLHTMVDEHTALVIASSVERADCPPSSSTWHWVRGEIKVSGYMARDASDGVSCELTYIVQVDPSGWLPNWVVNVVAADQADNVTRIAQYFAKQKK